MEKFILKIDVDKFRATNGIWNDLMLNDPWSVGYVSTLIEAANFKNKEEWEEFYYRSGQERKDKISKLSLDDKEIVENESLIRTNRQQVNSLSWNLKNLNRQKGRTKDDFRKKGEILHQAIKDKRPDVSIEECIECVRFRVICETWNGIVLRERNTIKVLESLLPNIEFVKAEGEKDHTYAVDYELYENNELLSAIQIKPKSYTWNASYLRKARSANERKFAAYKEKYGATVYTVISKSNGMLLNKEVIKNLK